MWSIWHKAVEVNEWRACIAPASISKQYVFCLPYTSESVKHKFLDCIKTRRAWRWATCITYELCFARCGPEIMILSLGNKRYLGSGSRRSLTRRSKFGIYLEASLFGSYGLRGMTRFLIMWSDTRLR